MGGGAQLWILKPFLVMSIQFSARGQSSHKAASILIVLHDMRNGSIRNKKHFRRTPPSTWLPFVFLMSKTGVSEGLGTRLHQNSSCSMLSSGKASSLVSGNVHWLSAPVFYCCRRSKLLSKSLHVLKIILPNHGLSKIFDHIWSEKKSSDYILCTWNTATALDARSIPPSSSKTHL